MKAFQNRKAGSDVFIRSDVTAESIKSLTAEIKVDYWLNYLYKQREALLGVPKIFLWGIRGYKQSH